MNMETKEAWSVKRRVDYAVRRHLSLKERKMANIYVVKLINGEVLEIEADSYDVLYRGKVFCFYLAPDSINSKIFPYRIPTENILYINQPPKN